MSRVRWLLAGIVALGAMVRVARLGSESYWFDEIFSVLQVRQSFGPLLEDLASWDVHPPLFPALLWLWTRLAGEGEVATRLLAVVAGSAALLPVYGIGRILHGPAVGLLAALLLALNPYAVFYSRETRAYAVLLLTACLATWLLLRWLERPGRGRWAGYVAGASLLAYTHVFGLFLLLAHALYVFVWVPPRRAGLLGAAALSAALFSPWLPVLAGQVFRVQEGFWIPPIALRDPFIWLIEWAGFSPTLGVLLGLAVLRGLSRADPGDGPTPSPESPRHPTTALLVLWVVVPIALPVAISLAAQPIFQPKYAILTLGAFAILAARGIRSLPDRWPVAAGGLLVVLLLLIQLPLQVHLAMRKEQWRELAAIGRSEAARGTVLVADKWNRVPLGYYLQDTLVTWLEQEADFERLEARARRGRGLVAHLQIRPARSPHDRWFQRRWPIVGERRLVSARVVMYAVDD